jgi:hypothetical protein
MNKEQQTLIQDLQLEIGRLTKTAGKSAEISQLNQLLAEVSGNKTALTSPIENETIKAVNDNSVKHPFHRPQIAKECLKYFSTSEVYKQLTHHVPKDEFHYDTLIQAAKTNWRESFGRHFFDLHHFTYNKLDDFVNTPFRDETNSQFYMGEKYGFWTYHYVIPIGWSAIEVAEWCNKEKNRNVYPNQMPIPKEKQRPSKNNRRIKYDYFGEVIRRFKYDIEQRTDDRNQTFDLLLREALSRVDPNRDLKLMMDDLSLKPVLFYADLVQLKKALDKIFTWIINRKDQSNQVKIVLNQYPDRYEVSIIHLKGIFTNPIDADKYNGTKAGDTGEIRKTLRSVCDWQVIYSTPDKRSYQFDYLLDGCNINLPVIAQQVPFIDSIQHKLTFYR